MYYAFAFLSGFLITFLVTLYKNPGMPVDTMIVLGLNSTAIGIMAIVIYAIIDAYVEDTK